MTSRRDMECVMESILFVSNDPVPAKKILEVFAEREREAAAEALQAVVERYRESPDSGVMIDEAGGGLRLVTRPDLHGYLRRFFEVSGTNKLSMPALETLAIVAYRQPVTAPEIQELRGVSSAGVLKTLLERRLVRISGRKEVVGKPFLYATTREFLMHFGLKNLKELPPLEQFEELFGGDIDAPDEEVGADHEEQVLRESAEIEEAELEAESEREAREEEAAAQAAAEDDAAAAAVDPVAEEAAEQEGAPSAAADSDAEPPADAAGSAPQDVEDPADSAVEAGDDAAAAFEEPAERPVGAEVV